MESVRIVDSSPVHLDLFLDYLSTHLSENGDEGQFFVPLNKQQLVLGEEWRKNFKPGFNSQIGDQNFKKIWLALNPDNEIIGHVDIRAYESPNSKHRVLLGMGVDQQFRQQKIGQKLLEFVMDYCQQHPSIDWLDLEVLSTNKAAIELYGKFGFVLLSKVEDRFRIDGKSFGYVFMALNVNNAEVSNKKIIDIWIESEHTGPILDGTLETNDNSDIIVTFDDGNRYVATAFTYQNIELLRAKNKKTGECMNGRYFWASDMLLLEKITPQEVEIIINHLIDNEEFEQVFSLIKE